MSAPLRALSATPAGRAAEPHAERLGRPQTALALPLPETTELIAVRVPLELSAEELRLNPCGGRPALGRGPAPDPGRRELPDASALSLLESALPRLADLGRIRALLGPDVGAALAPRADAARIMAEAIQSLLALRADAESMRHARLGV